MAKQNGEGSKLSDSAKVVNRCSDFCDQINRIKTLNADVMATPLSRCLTTEDLTFLGISYMIGPGIYVVTGTVIHTLAGAGAIFSYLIAGMAAFLSAMCYAECGSRIPSAGSAYAFTYVSFGEIWAFIVGWNMLLEYLIVVASGAKAWSSTLDAVCNKIISERMTAFMGLPEVEALASYPDFVAVGIIVLAIIFVSTGAKTSVTFNNILSVIVILSILIVIGGGFSEANIQIWTNSTYGGFLPYGLGGVFQASATCFYSYLGFDGIAVAAEEAINPKEALPWAIGISMLTVTILYVLATIALTLMVPYVDIYVNAPYTIAFAQAGMVWAKYIVSIGSLIAITTTITGGMYFLPRIAYSMASDGLIFSIFGKVNEKTQIPATGTIILGAMASVLALFIELSVLVLLMSIGTLISFTFVAANIVILRYRTPNHLQNSSENATASMLKSNEDEKDDENHPLQEILGDMKIVSGYSWLGLRTWFLNTTKYKTYGQERLAILLLLVLFFCSSFLMITIVYAEMAWWSILFIITFLIVIIMCAVFLSMMTQFVYFNTFKVPFVPFFPIVTIICNLTMIFLLDVVTWIRLAIWMFFGFIMYFSYGLKNSKEIKLKSNPGLQLSTYGSLDNKQNSKDQTSQE